MKKLVCCLFLIITIAGCSNSPLTNDEASVAEVESEEIVARIVCTIDTNFLTFDSAEYHILSTGNSIDRLLIKGLVGEMTPFDKEMLDSLEAEPTKYGRTMNEIVGVNKSFERIDDTTYFEIVEFDFVEGDFLDFMETGYLGHANGYNKNNQIETDQFVDGYERIGFICKVQ